MTQQHIPQEENPHKLLNWKISDNAMLQLVEIFYKTTMTKEMTAKPQWMCTVCSKHVKRRDMVYWGKTLMHSSNLTASQTSTPTCSTLLITSLCSADMTWLLHKIWMKFAYNCRSYSHCNPGTHFCELKAPWSFCGCSITTKLRLHNKKPVSQALN